jgi:hypothetical protein
MLARVMLLAMVIMATAVGLRRRRVSLRLGQRNLSNPTLG